MELLLVQLAYILFCDVGVVRTAMNTIKGREVIVRQTQVRDVGSAVPPLFVQHQNTDDLSLSRPWNENALFAEQSSQYTGIGSSSTYKPEWLRPTVEDPVNRCLKPRGVFPSNFCNKYINCWDGMFQEQTCPENLLFNVAGYCDYFSNVDCKGRTLEGFQYVKEAVTNNVDVPTQSVYIISNASQQQLVPTTFVNTNTVDPKLLLKCFQPRGQFPTESCNKFVNCWDGQAMVEECPKGLLFSEKGYCDFPVNVNCGKRDLPSEFLQKSAECPNPHGVFMNKSDCNKYIMCALNIVLGKYECPSGLYYNEAIGVCDYPTNVKCNS